MFSLIIAIVSIALVVALVAATMYHGGDTLTQGRAKADAAAVVGGAQQVAGAAVMYSTMEGSAATDVAALVTKNYLGSVPNVTGIALAGAGATKTVTATVASAEVCTAINKAAGSATPDAVTDVGALPYGCLTADKTFSFKY